MTLGGERGSVQNPFLRYAPEAGWIYSRLRFRRGPCASRLNPRICMSIR